MNFEASCKFGKKKSCDSALVQSMTTPSFSFPINFVTAGNKVVKAYPIGRYFWLLDTMGRIRIEKVYDKYDEQLNVTDKEPLQKVAVWDQMRRLGCIVNK
jgi:hypothetical protein